jgi:hypothetical protein
MLENPRLAPFALQLTKTVFYPFSLTDHQSSKPANQDIQLQRSGKDTRRTKASSQGKQASHHTVKLSAELPFKRWAFSLKSGMAVL